MATIGQVPNIDSVGLDSVTRTRAIFEAFAEHSERGDYAVKLLLPHRQLIDRHGGVWRWMSCIVNNVGNNPFTDRIVVTSLKNGNDRSFEMFKRYVVDELSSVSDICGPGECVFVRFGIPYRLGAQTQTDHETRRAGCVSELLIVGVVARRLHDVAPPKDDFHMTEEQFLKLIFN